MKKIFFIAHGGINIGMGHVIRCMSLANAFQKKGYQIKFISKYKTGQKVLQDNNYEVIAISGLEEEKTGFYYGSMTELNQDLISINRVLDQENPDVLVIDSYNITADFLSSIAKRVTCSLYIDDLAQFPYPVDIVLNGNISAYCLEYKASSKNQRLLLGLEYNLIREEFINLPKRNVSENCKSIMISTGAADPHHMTEQILQILLKYEWLKKYTLHVVIGNGFKEESKENIKKIASKSDNIRLHINPVKISSIMMQSDLAITAGGSTIYELFACGVITFAFIYAENQRSIVEMSSEKGYLFPIGDYQKIQEEKLIANIKLVTKNMNMRKELVAKLQNILDCKGTKRIVNKVEKFLVDQTTFEQ